MKKILLFTLALLPATADTVADAAAQLRVGRAADALQMLTEETGAEAAFWRARALISLGRLSQAVAPLQEVPQEHALFPYAAKALIYCAWQSAAVNPDEVLPPLLNCGDENIRTLSAAALAEYHLNRPASAQSDELMQFLRARAEEDDTLRDLLHLLEIADLRRRGDFTAAIERCRRLEGDRSLPLLTRHRLRLTLAEVYYAQEDSSPAESSNRDDDTEEEVIPRGRGEETLLHFISSNPDSPLLNEAFRRLMLHEAFLTSEAARERLREWCENMRYPRRASQALLVQQRLLNPEGNDTSVPDSASVNTAITACPNEAATVTMLQEQVRLQLQHGNRTDAALYLARIPAPSSRRDFLSAALITSHRKAAGVFLNLAENADEELQLAAYHNALLHALMADDADTVSATLEHANLPIETAAELHSAAAAYLAETNPSAALHILRELRDKPLPPSILADVILDTAALHLAHPELFGNAPYSEEEVVLPLKDSELSEEQILRRIALTEHIFLAKGERQEALNTIIRQASDSQYSPRIHAVLNIHLSHLLSAEGRHVDAFLTLQNLIAEQPKGELTPRARMLCARQAELIGTADSLKVAAAIYGQCAEDRTPNTTRCLLRRAAVFSRLGETERARTLIDNVLAQEESLSRADRMIAYAILSNILVQEGTPDSLQAAVTAASHMLGEPGLSPRHQALSLMHHGMICTRAGKDDLALGDYLAVLSMKPAHAAAMEERDYNTLRRAAAGAVYTSCNLGRYEEAAALAEEAAAWPLPAGKEHLRDSFLRWAQSIRKIHFLSAGE